MIIHTFQRIGFIGLLFIVVACNVNTASTSSSQESAMSDTLKFEGCQESVNMTVGTIVEIRLEAIPGTGYQWLLKEPSQLLQLLDADSLKFSRPETKEPMVGQPGFQILHFRAIKQGEETLELIYKQTFADEILNICSIKVIIK